VRLLPKSLGTLERVDVKILPPSRLITGLMQLPVMTAAERYCELVANFQPNGAVAQIEDDAGR